MITLHHLDHSQSFRILWLLEELDYPYELKLYKREKDDLAPMEYKKISPTGTAPVITDDTNGLVLSESNAIIDYILDQAEASGHDIRNLRPSAQDPARTDYLFWFHASQASLQFLMGTDSLFRMLPSKVPFPIKMIMKTVGHKMHENFIDPRLTKILDMAEEALDKHAFLAADHLTAADITAVYSFDAVTERMPDWPYPKIREYYEKLQSRPAFRAALEKAGEERISFPL